MSQPRHDLTTVVQQVRSLARARNHVDLGTLLATTVNDIPAQWCIDHFPSSDIYLEFLATASEEIFAYATAQQYWSRLVDLRAHVYPADSTELAEAYGHLGQSFVDLKECHRAKPFLDRALDGLHKHLPPDDIKCQRIHLLLARIHQASGDVAQALDIQRRVIATLEALASPENDDLLNAQSEHANTLYRSGQSYRALSLLEHVYTLRERADPTAIHSLDEVRNNLADMKRLAGDLFGARRLLEQVIKGFQLDPFGNTNVLLTAQENLSLVLAATGERREALALQQHVLGQRSAAGTDDSESSLISQHNLAISLAEQGRLEEAYEIKVRVLESCERALHPNHPLRIAALNNLATTLSELGRFEEAYPLAVRAVGVSERLCPPDSPELHPSRISLAAVLQQLGRPQEARQIVLRCVEGARLQAAALSMSASYSSVEQLGYSLSVLVSRLITMGNGDSDSNSDEVDALGLQRIVVDLCRARLTALRSLAHSDAALATALDRSTKANEHFSILLGDGSGSEDSLRAARNEVERAQADLAVLATRYNLVSIGSIWPRGASRMVTQLMRSGDVLVVTATVLRVKCEPLLYAYVFRRGHGIVRHCLGEHVILERQVSALRDTLQECLHENDSDHRNAVTALSASLSPLLDILPTPKGKMYVCTEGALATIPWELLCVGNTTLGQLCTVLYGTAPSRVLDSRSYNNTPPSLLCMGGIDFDAAELPDPDAVSETVSVPASHYGALLQSGREATSIAALFSSHFSDRSCTLSLGKSATRALFLERCSDARFIHLATHAGTGAPNDWSTVDEASASRLRGLLQTGIVDRGSMAWIVFAGANRRDYGPHMTQLTGADIDSLDLGRCELAVVSACRTNVGERWIGDATAGVNRALQVAGAQWTISSLWSVDDLGTCLFFEEFYRQLWVYGESVCTALAQTRSIMRAQGLPPGVWTSFVLYGPYWDAHGA
jgi:CHAT domain-containing protein/tetratricopeptide (TPR) repeat protein